MLLPVVQYRHAVDLNRLYAILFPSGIMDSPNIAFSDSSPPIRLEIGRALYTISPKGDLIINSSSTIRLHCIFPKSRGQPVWETSSTYRKYPQSWTKTSLAQYPDIDAYQVPQQSQDLVLVTTSKLHHHNYYT